MSISTGFRVAGVDLSNIFQVYSSGNNAATGYKVNGRDLSSIFQAYTTGTQAAVTGYKISGGGDLNSVFSKFIPTGSVWFWGYNINGQLGGGTRSISYLTPTKIPNGANGFVNGTITAIYITFYECLALDTSNNVWFWGSNEYGQLGDTTHSPTSYLTPTKIPNGANGFVNGTITNIYNGIYGCLALDTSNNVWFWGYNVTGQLGGGATSGYLTPTKIPNGANGFVNGTITACSISENGCLALDTTKNVWFWGNNYDGQLGNGTGGTISYLTPTKIPNGSNGFVNGTITTISINSTFSQGFLAIDTSKYVWFWGNNINGQLGNATGGTNSYLTPTKIPNGANGFVNGTITAVSIGAFGCLAIDISKNVWFWGSNTQGQLGSGGSYSSYYTPTKVPNGANGFVNGTITAISIGSSGCLALDTSKNVWFWGSNLSGQLGSGTGGTTSYLTPTKIPNGGNGFVNGTINAVSIDYYGCLAF
jgi:alpha-tubulin suppressor-like RCC1 family protein